MTRVTLYEDAAGEPRGYQVEDHSGYDVRGRDVVCAAVSVLSLNTINSIEALTGDRFSAEVDPGQTRIRCLFREAPGEGSLLLLRAFALGIRSICETYGKHVQVQVRRISDV